VCVSVCVCVHVLCVQGGRTDFMSVQVWGSDSEGSNMGVWDAGWICWCIIITIMYTSQVSAVDKTHILYFKSHDDLYWYYKLHEDPYHYYKSCEKSILRMYCNSHVLQQVGSKSVVV